MSAIYQKNNLAKVNNYKTINKLGCKIQFQAEKLKTKQFYKIEISVIKAGSVSEINQFWLLSESCQCLD